MSNEAKPAKKGGKMKKILMIGGGALLLLGGGGAAGMYAGGKLGGSDHGKPEDPDKPKLVLKEGQTAPVSAGGHGSDAGPVDAERYKATYFPLEQTFTSNLVDTNGFAQIGVGVSTLYDQKVLDNLKEHEMPVRSAILMTLADQEAEVLSTPEGKKMLQKKLKVAINDVLKEKSGFGGIDDVYFTSFIIS